MPVAFRAVQPMARYALIPQAVAFFAVALTLAVANLEVKNRTLVHDHLSIADEYTIGPVRAVRAVCAACAVCAFPALTQRTAGGSPVG